ncbi:MAG: hypothetical protein JSS72_00165 [Armatimonadetes bacterium]|nr:hypothetical protein [Armatimonadota bacterium]
MLKKFIALAALALSASLLAQDNDVMGQEQLKGINGTFGTTYTLQSRFNLTIYSAKYSLEPVDAYEATIVPEREKLVVFKIGVKNAADTDNFFSPDSLFTLVDDKQQQYAMKSIQLASQGNRSSSFTLRPSQGIGQPALNDPLIITFSVPYDAKIDKLMVNSARLGHDDEKVIRFELAAPPTSSDSKVKNFIAPLPPEALDPTGQWGSKRLELCKGTMGVFVPSAYFGMRLDSIASPDGAVYAGSPPEDGKRYVVATVTVKALLDREISIFEAVGGDNNELVDADGEHYRPVGFRKSKADDDPERTFHKGDEYTYRIFYAVPKDAKLKNLVLAGNTGVKWSFEVGS